MTISDVPPGIQLSDEQRQGPVRSPAVHVPKCVGYPFFGTSLIGMPSALATPSP